MINAIHEGYDDLVVALDIASGQLMSIFARWSIYQITTIRCGIILLYFRYGREQKTHCWKSQQGFAASTANENGKN